MTLDSAQTLFLTLTFIVPGFIMDSVCSKFVARHRPESHVAFLRYLTFSSLNYAVWSWLVYWLLVEERSLVVAFFCWVLITIVSPVAIGLLLSYAHQNQWLKWLAKKARLRIIHATPTAWDYVFSRQGAAMVQVTLTDGRQIRGFYSNNSFSSSDPNQRDIYLEQACRLVDKKWCPLESGTSVLITSQNIEYIQFIPLRKKSESKGQEAVPQ